MATKRRLKSCRVLWAWSALAVLLLSTAAPANTMIVGSPASVGTEVDRYNFPPPQPQFSPGLGPVDSDSTGFASAAMVFDLSFIPKGTSITSATFTMSVGGSFEIYHPPSLNVFDYVGTGPTVSLTDFSQGAAFLGSIGGLPASASPGTIDVVNTFNATSFIQSLVNNGTPYAGFLFQDAGGGAEYIPGSTAPFLSISSPAALALAVPEPQSALMLALGIGGVLLVSLVARPLGITRRFAPGRTRQ
jgi:hypothetical protein